MWGGDVDWSLVYNWTDTEVDAKNAQTISATRIRQLEENLPDVRATIGMTYTRNEWRVTSRYNHYSGCYEAHLDDGGLPIEASRSATVDLEIGYDYSENLNIVFGAQNLFDEYPDDLTEVYVGGDPNNGSYAGIVGANYPTTSPFGFNGGYYYLKLGYRF